MDNNNMNNTGFDNQNTAGFDNTYSNQGYNNQAYNNQPYSNQTYSSYDNSYAEPVKKNGLAIAGFVLAILGFVFNPCYICSILGFIFGLVGLNTSTDKTYRGLALAAWIIALVSFIAQVLADIIITVCSMGFGVFSIFI